MCRCSWLGLTVALFALLGLPNQLQASDRQGGDTIATSVIIWSLPFQDGGTTAGFTNDYDAQCPNPSSSPDVVYQFTNDKLYESLTIDLCGADYDSKIFIYDNEYQLVACNDDYPCSEGQSLQSRIENFPLAPYMTYYIIIDGSNDEAGGYTIYVEDEGACCLSSGECVMTTESNCTGTWMGSGVSCTETDCPATPVDPNTWGWVKSRFRID
jgi:hypothetical protein